MFTLKKGITFFIFIILLIVIFNISISQASYFNYQENDELQFRTFTILKTSMEGTGQLVVDNELELTSELTQRIETCDDDRVLYNIIFNTINVNKYNRIVNSFGERIIDSKNYRANLQSAVNGLLGKEALTMEIDSNGYPLTENVSDEVKCITNIDLADIGRQLSLQIPSDGLFVGNSWVDEVTFMLPPPITGGSFKGAMYCEVVGKEMVDGYDCFIIKTNTRKSDVLMLTDKQEPTETDFIDVAHIAFSYMYFSTELGHLVRKVTSQTLNVIVYLAGDGDRQPVNNIIRTEMDSIVTYFGTKRF